MTEKLFSRLIEWLDRHLVPTWRTAWRWASVQIAVVQAGLATLFVDGAAIALGLAGVIEDSLIRNLILIGVFLAWLLPALGLRLWDQRKDKTDDANEA